MPITVEQIVKVGGAPPEHVRTAWPLILSSLTARDMPQIPAQIAAVATVCVESPRWIPQAELYNGNPDTYFARYDNRADLGNVNPGDGLKYKGRGYIQITGRANYRRYGLMLGLDLLNSPELALAPSVAADILALYFRDRNVDSAADRGDWVTVRKLVNGGLNGIDPFLKVVHALEGSV
jgi:predicted chitinase